MSFFLLTGIQGKKEATEKKVRDFFRETETDFCLRPVFCTLLLLRVSKGGTFPADNHGDKKNREKVQVKNVDR